jgi:hypothetical protein
MANCPFHGASVKTSCALRGCDLWVPSTTYQNCGLVAYSSLSSSTDTLEETHLAQVLYESEDAILRVLGEAKAQLLVHRLREQAGGA